MAMALMFPDLADWWRIVEESPDVGDAVVESDGGGAQTSRKRAREADGSVARKKKRLR